MIKAHTVDIPLHDSQLKSGAKLSWTGHIYVTTSAPQCRLSVAVPRVHGSVGPVKVTTPPINLDVPTKVRTKLPTLPTKIPNLGRSRTRTHQGSGAAPGARSKRPTVQYTAPVLSVPDQVVPQGQGDTVYGSNGGVVPNTVAVPGGSAGSSTGGSTDTSAVGAVGSNRGGNGGGSISTGSARSLPNGQKAGTRPLDLASSPTGAPSGQLPVLLAILAVLALAFVAGTYARLYLLGRKK